MVITRQASIPPYGHKSAFDPFTRPHPHTLSALYSASHASMIPRHPLNSSYPSFSSSLRPLYPHLSSSSSSPHSRPRQPPRRPLPPPRRSPVRSSRASLEEYHEGCWYPMRRISSSFGTCSRRSLLPRPGSALLPLLSEASTGVKTGYAGAEGQQRARVRIESG